VKIVLVVVGALLALVVLVFVLQYVASESGEVVVVHSVDADGSPRETRVWVVDDAGAQWLRTSNTKSKWMARVNAHPEIEVTRGGVTRAYVAVPVPEARARVVQLMSEKYGWADQVIGVMLPRDESRAVRLDPR
jgi:hypothetical protein